ncbi:MAG: carboxypeptidase regulatory-like domain-containing protein, partial [Anaerolineae bacterium]|nr:carboxypeptidase regulatory-like domain-containing protein [Anaerolineae bacterium]
DRYFVIEWHEVEHYPDGNPETFEIVLDLDTNRVTIQYQTVSYVGDAVAGVENSTGTEATQYADSDPALIVSGAAVDFYPTFGTPPPTGGLGILQGTVTDLNTGAPIEGATVTALSFTEGTIATLTTGSNGVYSGTLCADWYDLTAEATGYYSSTVAQVAVLYGAETVQDFALQRQQMNTFIYLPLVFKSYSP